MKTNIFTGFSPPILYLVKFCLSIYGPECSQQIKLQDSYFKKEVKDKVYFWHEDKHQSLLQVDTIIMDVYNQTYPKYQK